MASFNSVGIPVPRPMPMNCRNRKTRWQEFKAEFNDYAVFTDLYKEPEEKQMTAFRLHLGPHWRSKLKMLTFPPLKPQEAGKACPALIAMAEALDKEFGAGQNILVLREKFYNFTQGELDVESYLDRLYEMASECEFPAQFREDMIRDRIVFGIHSTNTKDRLMSAERIDLNSVLSTVRRLVDSKKKSAEEPTETINLIKRKKHRKQGSSSDVQCEFCGFRHSKDRTKCPASGKTCGKCFKKGHFKQVCKSKGTVRVNRVDFQEDDDGSEDGEEYSFESTYAVSEVSPLTISEDEGRVESTFAVGESSDRFKSITITLTGESMGKRFPIRLQIDTGASCSILPRARYNELVAKNLVRPLEQSNVFLKMYNGEISRSLGRCSMICHYGSHRMHVTFEVADTEEQPLLSAYASYKLGIIRLGQGVEFVNQVKATATSHRSQLNALIKRHETVFQGLGRLPGTVAIHVKDQARPVQCLPKKVPVAIKDQVIDRILELEKMGVIERIKHDQPSPWISQMLVVTREGKKPRITLDPFHLNQATRRCHFRMPTLTDILPHLRKVKVFTVCDAADGFYQCVLDGRSTDCTAFWTPLGRFKYLRMPQGLNISPSAWPHHLRYVHPQMEVLEGLRGVHCVADDLLITGSGDTDEEAWTDHCKNLEALLVRCEQRGLRSNRSKLKLCADEVKFLGHILTTQGVKSDPEKVETIKRMLPPTNKTSLQRFLGAINYHHSFIRDLSTHTAPLRDLLKNNVDFVWGPQQNSAFETLKEKLCSRQVLAYYDAKKPVLIRSDASQHSVGAVLLQDGRPVDYCSAALRPAEKNYAVIEKELLAILIACEKFEHYIIYHPNVKVETDHQPLMAIFKRPLYDAPKRLQRMLLRLQKFRLEVSYINGKSNTVADWLSRDAPITKRDDQDSNIQEFVFRINAEQTDAEKLSPVSNRTLERIKDAAKGDPEFQALEQAIKSGWPAVKHRCEDSVASFWKYRSELVHAKGLIYKGSAVFIPKSLRKEMLKISHSSHYGFRLQWRRVSRCIFWPGLKSQLEEFCNNCEACLTFQVKQRKQPMIETTSATLPFQVVFQDLFDFRAKQYLVTVDVFSDFFEVDNLGETATATKVIQASKRHFARYGIPVELHSDNGPQFASKDFKEFTDDWKITHITSSPYFSQSNGKAEAAVKIAKRLLKKTTFNEEDYEYALLEARNVPQPEGVSRTQKFLGRVTRTKLPSMADQSKGVDRKQIARNKLKAAMRKKHYDKGARPLKRLHAGDVVRIQPRDHTGMWKRGICDTRVGPRSYKVKLNDGAIVRRNRRHLILTKQTSTSKTAPSNRRTTAPTTPVPRRLDPATSKTNQKSILQPSKLKIKTPLLDRAAESVLRRSTRERKCRLLERRQEVFESPSTVSRFSGDILA